LPLFDFSFSSFFFVFSITFKVVSLSQKLYYELEKVLEKAHRELAMNMTPTAGVLADDPR